MSDQIVWPGGRLTLYSNGTYTVLIKSPDHVHHLTVVVAVPDEERHQPNPEIVSNEPDFDVPDSATIELQRNDPVLVRVAGEDITLVVKVAAPDEPPRHHVRPERRLP